MKQYLLGIDVGTTGTKTLLFSADGELLGHAYRPYALHTPQVGYSEQNAEDWWYPHRYPANISSCCFLLPTTVLQVTIHFINTNRLARFCHFVNFI